MRAIIAIVLLAAFPARAEWRRAETTHFIIYSDAGEAALREQAIDLERFDALLRLFHDTARNEDAVHNRVTIYVVPGLDMIRRLSRDNAAAGFYVPRVTGSIAFTPRASGDGGRYDLTPRIVLYHEYAHHFLLGGYAVAYPAWFSEGYAEFASTMTKKDGAYWLGTAANHRAYGLMSGRGLSARQLFDPPARMNAIQRDALYGRGWLLTHLAMFDEKRRAQLALFLRLFNEEVPAASAAERSFGDLKALDRDLDRYLSRSTLPAIRVPPERLGDPKVVLRTLSPGEAAMMLMRMQSTGGVDGKTAGPLYARAAPVAARFPADATVQGWFAEIALDAGEFDAADRAADAAIAADPRSSQALLYKARIGMTRIVLGKSTDPAAWRDVRAWIVRANRADNSDAAALALFYQTFLAQKEKPRESAKEGLYRATTLVPQDLGLRLLAARQRVLDGDADGARPWLRILAANPHARDDNPAIRLIAALDAGKRGQAALDAADARPVP